MPNQIYSLNPSKPYSSAYLKSIHSQLSAIFNHAIRFYKLKENPAEMSVNACELFSTSTDSFICLLMLCGFDFG